MRFNISKEQKYNLDITEFVIWVIEIVARKFFENDKTLKEQAEKWALRRVVRMDEIEIVILLRD